MHNYNVANRFTTKTKLGNWYEEKELDDHDFKEYLYQKEKNNNLTLNTTAKLGFSNQQVALSKKQGKWALAPGDNIQLYSACTEGVLAFNINEAILGEETYAVTTSRQVQPVLRNVLTVEYVGDNVPECIRYGDKIRLAAQAGNRKLYLQSLAISPMRSSKLSRLQQVSMTATLSASTLWMVEKVNAKQRFDSVGKGVAQGQAILLRHVSTGQWLASDLVKYINDFGSEFQVFSKSYLSANKTQNLFAEKQGHGSVGNSLRSQGVQNEWLIVKG